MSALSYLYIQILSELGCVDCWWFCRKTNLYFLQPLVRIQHCVIHRKSYPEHFVRSHQMHQFYLKINDKRKPETLRSFLSAHRTRMRHAYKHNGTPESIHKIQAINDSYSFLFPWFCVRVRVQCACVCNATKHLFPVSWFLCKRRLHLNILMCCVQYIYVLNWISVYNANEMVLV